MVTEMSSSLIGETTSTDSTRQDGIRPVALLRTIAVYSTLLMSTPAMATWSSRWNLWIFMRLSMNTSMSSMQQIRDMVSYM